MSTYLPDPLERALNALAADIDFPEPRDVRGAVVARIRADSASVVPRPGRFRWQPAIALVFVLALVLTLTLTALPQARRAIADFLGFDNLRINVVETPPPALPLGEGLDLGTSSSVSQAVPEVGAVPLLDPDTFTGPRSVYVSDESVDMVTVAYGEAPGLPPESLHDISVLLTAIDGDLHDGFVEKVVATGSGKVRPVEVRGQGGYWVSGEHPFFLYSRADGTEELEDARIANNVLVWEEGGLILRIEGELTRGEAVALAEDMVLQE